MLKIKLVRIGKKKQPFYRIVVAQARDKLRGRHLDLLGFYNPLTDPQTIEINKDKYQDWLGKGAQPTKSVRSLVKKAL